MLEIEDPFSSTPVASTRQVDDTALVITNEDARALSSSIIYTKILQLDRIQYRLRKILFDHTTASVVVAGGYITKSLQNEEPNDIDLFFSSRKDIARLVLDFRKTLKFKHTYLGKNLIRGTVEINNKKVKLDVVKRLFPSAKETIENFDFTICCFAITKDAYCYHVDAPFDLLQKKLNVNHVLYPAATMMRLQKYVQRDFTYCKGVVRQLMERIKDQDITVSEQFFYEDGILNFNNID